MHTQKTGFMGADIRGFSLIEVLLALSLVVLIVALSVPRLTQPQQKINRISIQTELMEITHELGLKLYRTPMTSEQIALWLPEKIGYSNDNSGEYLYSLHYYSTETGWYLAAFPEPGSYRQDPIGLFMDWTGHCYEDSDANRQLDPEDDACY
ncbi:MAG: prepilin-type N-terminal cleavage/methylation domain-containing protein [Gammaproteobacteria bacterium]